MGGAAGGAGDPGGSSIELGAGGHEVDQHVVPGVGDGIRPSIDLDRAGRLELPVAELGEQGEKPPPGEAILATGVKCGTDCGPHAV
jgi:hypothetical protein